MKETGKTKIEFLNVKEEKIPVVWKGEVLIIGGSAAGVVAGAASGRKKINTMIIEKNSYLGGRASGCAGLPIEGGFPGYVSLGGIMDELCAKLRFAQEEPAVVADIEGKGVSYYHENEYFKFLAEDILKKSGCKWALGTTVYDLICKEKKICGVLAVKNMEKKAFLAEAVIDATGDGQIAKRVGVLREDRDRKSYLYPYILEGIDQNLLENYLKEDPGFHLAWELAKGKGELPDEKNTLWRLQTRIREGWVYGNTLMIERKEGQTEEEILQEFHKKLYGHIAFFRKYIPGMEACRLLRCTVNPVRILPRKIRGIQAGDEKYWKIKKPFKGILRMETKDGKQEKMPLGMIISRDIDNLFVVGRVCDIQEDFRERLGLAQEMVIGQAAGLCAALTVLRKIEARNLEEEEVHSLLNELGCDLDGDLSREYQGDKKILVYQEIPAGEEENK